MANPIRKHSVSSSSGLVAQVLEQPGLVRAVRALDGASLGKLIQHVGLEDAADVIALASAEQLEEVLDQDLWRAERVAGDEHFDPKRFATWLEVLLDVGEAFAVRRVCALPRDLFTLAVHRLVLVIDMDALASDPTDDGTEKALESTLHDEWEEFRLIARQHDGWDALWQVLVALDQDHHDLLRGVLERCAALDAELVVEHGGLFETLSAAEVLEDDVADERASRRGARGYVTPADARSFLKLAAQPEASYERDPMTKAYFRGLSPREQAAPAKSPDAPALYALLSRAGVLDAPMHAGAVAKLPSGSARSAKTPRVLLEAAMEELRDEHPAVFEARREELAYLANVVLAGTGDRELRPIEALELALERCGRGLQRQLKGKRSRAAALEILLRMPADLLFRLGSAAKAVGAT